MKNRTKFLIIILSIIFLVVLIIIVVLFFNKNIIDKTDSRDAVINEAIDSKANSTIGNGIDNVSAPYNKSEQLENRRIEIKNEADENSSKENDDIVIQIYEGIDYKEDLSKYYYGKNWFIEDKVVDEKKEELPFFDRLDGKVAKVTRTINRKYKWVTDINDEDTYIKDSFVIIPIATSSEYAYKYYFDSEGYLIRDNISKDWTILDYIGREIDEDLKPVKYYIGNKDYSTEHIEKYVESKEEIYYLNKNKSINATPSQMIITDGVVFRNKLERIYNTKINRDMTKYIVGGSGYQTNTKGKVWTKATWEKTLRLRKDSSYIVFENYMHNFNKIYGKIAMEYTVSSDRETRCRLVIYDKEEYDKGNIDEYIYYKDDFNYAGVMPFSFTFDRSIKNIVFVLYVDGTYRDRAVYFKDLKYGFSKSVYREEIIRKREEKEEIEYLKSLGLYVEDDIYFDLVDEDGEILDEIEEEIDEIEKYFDNEEYYDELLDRKSGPAFDEELNKRIRSIPFGPYIEAIGTKSEIKTNEKYKSKIVYTE